MADIQLQNLRNSCGAVPVMRNVELHIADGQICVFVGPGGRGQSTPLRRVAGLQDITGGDLLIVKAPGATHAEPRHRIAFGLPASALHGVDAGGRALPRCVADEDVTWPVAT